MCLFLISSMKFYNLNITQKDFEKVTISDNLTADEFLKELSETFEFYINPVELLAYPFYACIKISNDVDKIGLCERHSILEIISFSEQKYGAETTIKVYKLMFEDIKDRIEKEHSKEIISKIMSLDISKEFELFLRLERPECF